MTITDVETHFWSKVDRPSPYCCWEWQGSRSKGYGTLAQYIYGEAKAHRFAYKTMVGPIPAGLDLDHLCRNPACVNPDHLEPVTRSVNIKRGVSAALTRARQGAKTECPRGHEYTEDNTYLDSKGSRSCKICRTFAARDYQRRKRLTRSTP